MANRNVRKKRTFCQTLCLPKQQAVCAIFASTHLSKWHRSRRFHVVTFRSTWPAAISIMKSKLINPFCVVQTKLLIGLRLQQIHHQHQQITQLRQKQNTNFNLTPSVPDISGQKEHLTVQQQLESRPPPSFASQNSKSSELHKFSRFHFTRPKLGFSRNSICFCFATLAYDYFYFCV